MKRFKEMNYYEVLDIPFDASSFEIKQAYRETLMIYNENSLSTYSFFTENERAILIKKIEEAFETLIDEKKRADYEKRMTAAGKINPSAPRAESDHQAVPIFQTSRNAGKDCLHLWIKSRIEEEKLLKYTEEIAGKDVISGRDLKKVREAIGMRLDELYELTRIGTAKLKAIEEDIFSELPPAVYLKNFLKLYAEIFHLDPEKVVTGYLKNMADPGASARQTQAVPPALTTLNPDGSAQ